MKMSCEYLNNYIDVLKTLSVEYIKDKEELKLVIEKLDECNDNASLDFRHESYENFTLRNLTSGILLEVAESIFGECDNNFTYPLFVDVRVENYRSRIAPLIDEPQKAAISIGHNIFEWHNLFYEVCHESIHLLNPVWSNTNGLPPKCAALEEGVAVKFAEEMFRIYMQKYWEYPSINSPIYSKVFTNKAYVSAFLAANKIPNKVLKEIREEFGSFGRINNFARFRELTIMFLCENEIEYLFRDFNDPTVRHTA